MIDAQERPPRRAAVLAGGLLIAVFGLAIGALQASFAYDDAWITYRYALNLASGNGLVYNTGERVFGTTAPGYAVLLGVLAWPNPETVPVISGVVCAIALAAAALALYTYGARRDCLLAGVVAAIVVIVNPLALEAFGGEMVPQAALALWALVAVALERPALAAACGVGATILRPDGAVVLVWALGWHVWRARSVPWRVVAMAGLALALWFGGLWFYFGSPLPATLAAKQAQRASGVWHGFGTDFVLWVLSLTTMSTPFTLPRTHGGFTTFLALGLAGLLVLPWRRRWWGLVAWPVLVCLAYRQLRLPFYHWYAVPPLILLAVTAGLSCDACAQLVTSVVRRWWPGETARRQAPAAIGAVIVAMVLVAVVRPLAAFPIATRDWFPGPGERGYIDIGRWLAANTPAEASVGYIEVGFVGYFSRRRIVDAFGLVTKDDSRGVAAGDFLRAYRLHRPDVILHSPVYFPVQMGHLERETWFTREYRAVATLDSGRGYPLTVYRRSAAASGPIDLRQPVR